MPSIELTYRGLCTRIDSADAGELAWLEEFLAPAFARHDRAPYDCRVAVVEDAPRLEGLRAAVGQDGVPVLCLVQDTGPVCLPARRDPGAWVIRDDHAALAYVVSGDRRSIEVVAAARGAARRTALMKLVRELAMSAAWSEASFVMHAAACVAGAQAILIAGPKRAGKSSLLLHALTAPGVRLLANDRVVLALEGTRAVAHPMPTIVNLRADTAQARYPDAEVRRAAYRFHFALTVAEAERQPPAADAMARALACSPRQLAHLFGVELADRAPAAVLLLPRVDPTAAGIAVRPLPALEAAARLPDVLFAAGASARISEVFALPRRAPAPRPDALARLWRAAVERLRVFECRLGADAYAEDPTRLLARICE